MDPLRAIADFLTGLIRTHKMNEWAKLMFMELFSFWISASFICGVSLRAGESSAVAVGSGLIAGSVAAITVFGRSPLTKGLLVALPPGLSKAEIETPQDVIRRN